MLHARETTLTSSVMYLSPLTSEVYLLVNPFPKLYVTFILQLIAFIFFRDKEEEEFSKNPSFKIAMSGWMDRRQTGIWRQASSQVYLLVDLFSKLYVTFKLQWIAFRFGRDEEEGQKHVPCKRDNSSFFVMYLSPLMSQFFVLINLFFKVMFYLYSSVDYFHIW